MPKKKKRRPQPWWRRWRRFGWLAGLPALGAAIGVVAYFVATSGGPGQEPEDQVEPAPTFSLPTVDGGRFNLADHQGQHNVLLFFNEGVGCGPCYDQIVGLEEQWDKFQALDVQLVSIMTDPMSWLSKDVAQYRITSPVAADEAKTVSTAYNALAASMHPGQKPGHTFILVNKQGNIIWRWDWSADQGVMYVDVGEIYKQVSKWLERRGQS